MKKLALTIAVAAIAATAAQAKTVYEEDGMSLDLTGEVAFEVVRDEKDESTVDYKTDNVDLEVKAAYDLENGVQVYGFYAFEFASWTEENVSSDDGVPEDELKDALIDHYIGVKVGGLHVRYGDQDLAVDQFGITEEKDSDLAYESVLGADDIDGGSAEVLVVEYSGDSFYIAASTDLPEGDPSDATAYDVFGKYKVADITLGAVFAVQDQDGEDGDDPLTSMGGSIEWKGIDSLKLANQTTYNQDSENIGTDFSFEYDFSSTFDIGGGLGYLIPGDESAETTYYYVNLDYDLHKDVDTYAELFGESNDDVDTQLGFVVGLSVDF
ncbi:porin [Reinekea thalattae]|uniref:Porin n=1 Tax=Reinekea thalattae TaxID=2593301 RepID=A0A5C8Z7X9_9GAMM|nr:porin [Reinekea thalattae]TXR53010.1 porin [Reinekea thalattae]